MYVYIYIYLSIVISIVLFLQGRFARCRAIFHTDPSPGAVRLPTAGPVPELGGALGRQKLFGPEALPGFLFTLPNEHEPGPPKEPKIMAQYPKIESTGNIGSIILAILEVQET